MHHIEIEQAIRQYSVWSSKIQVVSNLNKDKD